MRFSFILLAALAVLFTPAALQADSDTASTHLAEERPRLVAARFTAAWCSQCRILEPRLDDVWPAYEDANLERVRFDFTLPPRRGAMRQRAVEAGIEDLYSQHEGRTGFLVLLDRETGEVLEMITTEHDRDAISAAFDRAIAATAAIES